DAGCLAFVEGVALGSTDLGPHSRGVAESGAGANEVGVFRLFVAGEQAPLPREAVLGRLGQLTLANAVVRFVIAPRAQRGATPVVAERRREAVRLPTGPRQEHRRERGSKWQPAAPWFRVRCD